MIEPIFMITVLNCFFMLSTTVSTCALWWRNKRCHCRHCGQRHSKDKSVHNNKNRKSKDDKSDIELENSVQCSETKNICYEYTEGSPIQNGCVRERRSINKKSDVKEMEPQQQQQQQQQQQSQQDNEIIGNKNRATSQVLLDIPLNTDNSHNDNTNYTNNTENNTKRRESNEPQVLNKNVDSIPENAIVKQSIQRKSLKSDPKSSVIMEVLANQKVIQCTNDKSNTSPDLVYCKYSGRKKSKCCG